jgi:hypothetical protein
MNLAYRLIFISSIIISITDILLFYGIKDHPERLTYPFLGLAILVTMIPIALNIWFHLLSHEYNMNQTFRMLLISTIIISVTDILVFHGFKIHPERLTYTFLGLVILVTVIPLAINIWFHF